MSSNSWQQTLITSQTDGSAYTNSTSAASLLPAAAKFTLPTNICQIGTKFQVLASGRISTAAATPGTWTVSVMFDSTAVFTATSGTLATSASNLTWDAKIDLICRAIGSGTSANLMGTGVLTSAALSASTPILLMPASSPAVGSGFDSTSSHVVDFQATWSVASASNTMTLHNYELVLCN